MKTPKKPRKRFQTESEIIAEIDKLKNLVKTRHDKASEMDNRADRLFAELNLEDVDLLCETKAQKWRNKKGKAERLREDAVKLRLAKAPTEKRMNAIGRKLSEMRTGILGDLLPDNTIQRRI